MNPVIDELRKERLHKAEVDAQLAKSDAILQGLSKLDATTVQAFSALIQFMQGHVSKTEVVNQLKAIESPTTEKAVNRLMSAVNDMHSTVKKKDVDLTPISTELKSVLAEVKKLQKNFKIPAPKVTVKSPDVKIPEQKAPIVNVDAPDISGIEKKIESLVKKLDEGIEVEHSNVLIHEKFDEWKIIEDDFDPEEPMPSGVVYYLKGKKVAELEYKTKEGRIVGVKKLKVN